ncbi:MAG: energy-coupling factor transporter transmembrane component T [Deltaproteobacteria bacterium]|nr:energy-coupling factor transporter transmembrane component T [Deltaproteobacteria bacterium]
MYHTGSFIKGQSLIFNLDPRLKLAATIGLSVVILWVKPSLVFITGIVLLFVMLVSGVSLRTIGQAIKPLLFFIILIFLVHVLFNEGDSQIEVPFFGILLPRAGLQQGFFAVWRFLCLIVAAVLLTMTTAPSQMIAAIKYFLRPLKLLRVPVDDIAVMIMLALRLMPILLTEKERVEIAQKARGYNLRRSSVLTRIKAFLSLTLTILLGVFRRADELAMAMEARSYQRGERTSLEELKFTSSDYLILIFFSFSLVIFVALN